MNNKNTRKVIPDLMQCEKLCLNGYVAATQGMIQCVLQIRLTHLENIYGLYRPIGQLEIGVHLSTLPLCRIFSFLRNRTVIYRFNNLCHKPVFEENRYAFATERIRSTARGFHVIVLQLWTSL
jgi:hypothetical protein